MAHPYKEPGQVILDNVFSPKDAQKLVDLYLPQVQKEKALKEKADAIKLANKLTELAKLQAEELRIAMMYAKRDWHNKIEKDIINAAINGKTEIYKSGPKTLFQYGQSIGWKIKGLPTDKSYNYNCCDITISWDKPKNKLKRLILFIKKILNKCKVWLLPY